ncbi:hypothetical protein BON30_39145 [Cystobacter ferrugineus]|uniref:Uncharacterized protein n=1 Tax=Cystobacter ferrugineus TaxID=83449 RepID=A0A1L9AYW3_9BACT|nr:hypothetical protein BON30_39145 [Cystobacter ferrugineus]
MLYRGGEHSASVAKTLTRLSWTAGQSEPDGSHRLKVSALASFAGAKRSQLAALTEAEVTAGLRSVVTGVTCLARARSRAPRLALAPIVLVRDRRNGLVPLERGATVHEVDEGGIYSW